VEFIGCDRDERVLVVAPGGAAELDVLAIDPAYRDRVTVRYERRLAAPPPNSWVDAAGITPDGRRVVAAVSTVFGGPSALVMFDVGTGEIIAAGERQDRQIQQLTISDDGRRVVFAATNGHLGSWEPERGPAPRILARDLGDQPKLAPLGGDKVVTAADDVRVWDVETGELTLRLGDHPGTWHLNPARPGEALTASNDWTVSLWDLDCRRELATLALDGEGRLAALSPDAGTFICADDAGDVYAFRIVRPT
jgi:WD40 repeat protein